MKNIYLLFLLTFLLNNLQAQDSDKGYIGIAIGPSIPTGDFGSVNMDNPKAAFASTGAIFDITFGYRLGKYFGIAAALRGQANPVDEEALENSAKSIEPDITWNASPANWGLGGLYFGGYGAFPIGNSSATFESRLMIGFLSATSPEITVTGTAYGFSASAITESKAAGTVGILLGAGFRINVGRKISLLLAMDITGCTADFENVQTYVSTGSINSSTYTQSISAVNIGFGVAYRLGAQ